MDIKNLTAEQKAELKAQLENEERAEKERITAEREMYKTLVDDTVRACVGKLKQVSAMMLSAKASVFGEFGAVIASKNELFKVKTDRVSDSFTTADGTMTVKLDNRVYEGWDDTVNVGIQKVQDYLKTLARDENSAALVDTVMRLLSKDRKGNLKASKVLELEKLAIRTGDAGFLDGIRIIKEAYKPVPSCQFIEVIIKDENGVEHSLPLSMSAIG